MPMLHEKADGTYCVWKSYDGCTTWQIDGKGLRYLKEHGVRFGLRSRQRNIPISNQLFYELFNRRLIYVGAA